VKANPEIARAVETVINQMIAAYKAQNISTLMACFAPDDDVTLIGTGADEQRFGPAQVQAQAERDWAQTESVEMSLSLNSISAAGLVAWAFADGAFNIRAGGEGIVLPARASFVLENRGGQWLIAHAHFSTPSAGKEDGSSV